MAKIFATSAQILKHTLTTLFLLFLLFLLIILWQSATNARETAIHSARQTCQQLGYQLLDDTVVLSQLTLKGWQSRQFYIHRVYRFSYSQDGDHCENGFIILHGQTIKHVGL
ncbi:MAG: DUF3301 domain-containing protein [Gammaproteobacteria bacterium]